MRILLSLLLVLGLAACQTVVKKDTSQNYVVVGLQDSPYSVYLKNRHSGSVVFCALIRSVDEFHQYFSPAAVMGDGIAYAPPAALFNKRQILVLARDTLPSLNGRSIMSVERLFVEDGELYVYYQLQPVREDATYTIRDGVEITLARMPLRQIHVYENNVLVAELTPQS
jgi:hypothetical protein